MSDRRPNEAAMKHRGDEEELMGANKGSGKRLVPLSHLRRWFAGIAATRRSKGRPGVQEERLDGQAEREECRERSQAFKHAKE